MYQLSQAMAAVRSSGTGCLERRYHTKRFQDQLVRLPKIHGKSVDEMIAKDGSFRLSLQEGWLTQEIMMETLKRMAGRYSDEQLASMGYTEPDRSDQAQPRLVSAAQDIKTFSQLMGVGGELSSSWGRSLNHLRRPVA